MFLNSLRRCCLWCWYSMIIWAKPAPSIANYCSFPSLSFGQVIGKLQGKVVTQFEELGWWSFSMVDCVTLFWLFGQHRISRCKLTKLYEYKTGHIQYLIMKTFPNNQVMKLLKQLGHFVVLFVPGNLWFDHLVKKGLHNPPLKYSTSQVLQNV